MSTLPDFTGTGFFAGEAPDGLTTIAGTPTSAQVRVYWRDPADSEAPDVLVASTQSAADGTWQIAGLNPALRYVVRAQKSQFDDVTVVGAMPARSDVIAYVNQLVPREDEFGDVDGLTGYVLLDSGLPPFTCEVIQPLPYGLTARIEGRKLLIEGVSTDNGQWSSLLRVTASNGVWVDVPVQVQIQVLRDPHFDKVALLLHFDEDFSDVNGGAFQAAGMVTFQPGKFNQGIFLTSGDSGAVEMAPSVALDLPADFAIEGWMMPAADTSGAFITRFQSGASAGSGWQIYLENTGRLSFYQYVSGGSYPIRGVGPDVRDGNWHHVAVTREAGLLRMFVDGVLVGTGSSSASYTSTIARLSVGYQVQGSARYPFRGGIDEVRITNGVARYTENFAPPDGPFPDR